MFKIHYSIAKGQFGIIYFVLVSHGTNHYTYSVLDREFKILDSGSLDDKEQIIPKMKSAVAPFGEYESCEPIHERNLKYEIENALHAEV